MLKLLERYTLREKAIVGVALLVVIMLGIHAFVIEPYQERITTVREAIAQQRADLAWMKSAVAGLPADRVTASRNPPGSQTLASRVDQNRESTTFRTRSVSASSPRESSIRARGPFGPGVSSIARSQAKGARPAIPEGREAVPPGW